MSLVINTNIASINSQRQLLSTNNMLKTSMERLSSGLRVNSAKDDAAGLAIGNGMTSQIRGMSVAVRNANDGVSLAQTAEAAMGVMTSTLHRMRDLAVQAATGTVTAANRNALNVEFQQLDDELTRIVNNTQFNSQTLLGGTFATGVNIQVGANTAADNQIAISIANLTAMLASGGSSGVTNATVSTAAKATTAMTAVDRAIAAIDTSRARLGAIQNRFTTTIANLQSAIENQSAARSRIMDADFAAETASLSRGQILQQAGVAMLAQANQAPQAVLGLLR